MAGLFAALLLRRIGWEVEVFERTSSELAARGAGIVTHPELMRALELTGAKPAGAPGVEISERVIINHQGVPIRRMKLRQLVTSWAYLFEILREALPDSCYRNGHALAEIEQTSSHVVARFSNGNEAHGNLLIGADGINSTIRSRLMPTLAPAYVGYIAWRGLVHESELSAQTHRLLANRFALYLPPGEEILGYPVAGPDNSLAAGSRYYNFVWYRPADSGELLNLLTDRDGLQHALSLPPDAADENTLCIMRNAANRLAPPFAEVVRLAPHPFIQAIHELESPRLVFGRVVLIGDAAFLARPHVGLGVTKAAGDAMALAAALAARSVRLEEKLARFERERLESGAKIVERSRRLGELIRSATSVEPIADEVIEWTAAASEV